MKKFMKFMSGAAVVLLVLVLVGIGLTKFNDWPVYVRDPFALMRWSDGETRSRGNVYWKLFSDEYMAELEIGAGVYGWAWVDRDNEHVCTPESPRRLMGLLLLAADTDPGLDPAPPEEIAENEWEYAFSSRMVTFNDGRYRCKIEF
jgi:hypothetical protein